ncbi:MAG: hypothetical protein WC489_06685 [Patescibacteria group bacterium]
MTALPDQTPTMVLQPERAYGSWRTFQTKQVEGACCISHPALVNTLVLHAPPQDRQHGHHQRCMFFSPGVERGVGRPNPWFGTVNIAQGEELVLHDKTMQADFTEKKDRIPVKPTNNGRLPIMKVYRGGDKRYILQSMALAAEDRVRDRMIMGYVDGLHKIPPYEWIRAKFTGKSHSTLTVGGIKLPVTTSIVQGRRGEETRLVVNGVNLEPYTPYTIGTNTQAGIQIRNGSTPHDPDLDLCLTVVADHTGQGYIIGHTQKEVSLDLSNRRTREERRASVHAILQSQGLNSRKLTSNDSVIGMFEPNGLTVGIANVGRARELQEDTFVIGEGDNGEINIVVGDGMGGNECGEVASFEAVGVAIDELMKPGSNVRQAVESAHNTVNVNNAKDPKRSIPGNEAGSTLNVARIETRDKRLSIGEVKKQKYLDSANVGDGVTMIFRPRAEGGMDTVMVSVEDSWVAEQVRVGLLTKEQAARHAQRNVITQAIGHGPRLNIHVNGYEVEQGDYILVATDGIKVRPEWQHAVKNILMDEQYKTSEEKARATIAWVNDNGGYDNTALVLHKVS